MLTLENIFDQLKSNPFLPNKFFQSSHMQLVAHLLTPYFKDANWYLERKFVQVSHKSKIAIDCCLQHDFKNSPTILLIHGINGSSSSKNIISFGHKAFHQGFNVILFNYRNMGGTVPHTNTLFHGGLSEDIKSVIENLQEWGIHEIYLAGYSLGGNMALKLAGELGGNGKKYVHGVAGISPVVDAFLSAKQIETQPFYQWILVKGLKHLIKKRAKLDGSGVWDVKALRKIKTFRDWDSTYQVGEKYPWGFINVDDYYKKISALAVMSQIQIPTLIIHAEDDNITPISPLDNSAITENSHIILLLTDHGGHGCFIAGKKQHDRDQYWAQNRVIDFFRLLRGEKI